MDIEQRSARLAAMWDLFLQELIRAEKKHPSWPGDAIHQAAIVAEEAGELIQASIDRTYFNGTDANIEKEAVQTAAMVMRLLLNSEGG